MEPVQKQVITLSQKVDALYQVIDELNAKVATALSECRLSPASATNAQGLDSNGHYVEPTYKAFRPTMEHKDVLADGTALDNHQSREKDLTPEIQIQRLTAQLTAAYNRIAALEEQLLAQRIH